MQQSNVPTRPAPLACDECRRKHLRCKGGSPCPRCALDGLRCAYTPSRRGLARRRPGDARSASAHISPTPSSAPRQAQLLDAATSLMQTRGLASPPDSMGTVESSPATTWIAERRCVATVSSSSSTDGNSTDDTTDIDHDRLIALYYSHFHEAHPILAPQRFYPTQQYPQYLELVVAFIGSHYAQPADLPAALQNSLQTAMRSTLDDDSVTRVQALVLYAIVLHVDHRTHEAESCIRRATRIAFNLGMNDPAFAPNNTAGNVMVAESYRRTWWELHAIEIYVAALHRRTAPVTATATTVPLLPCAKDMFDSGCCSTNSPTLRAFEDRVFALGTPIDFSSYSYRIEATRIISRVLTLNPTIPTHQYDVEAVDHAIASWKLNLTPAQSTCVTATGAVDELLFQAHYLIHCASIFLHFPRSSLPAKVPSIKEIACASAQSDMIYSPIALQHKVKTIAAAREMANLAALPCALENHSPLFVCGLILGSIVHLAAATSHSWQPAQLQQHRDHVALMLGTLGRLSERWAVARNAVACLKAIAQIIFLNHDGAVDSERSIEISAQDLGGHCGELEDFSNIAWFDLFSPDEMQSVLMHG